MENTLAVWLDKQRDRDCLNWVNQFVLLGISFHILEEMMMQVNYDQKLSGMDKVFNMYTKLKLSLIWRINVTETLALPKLVNLTAGRHNRQRATFD